MNLINRLEEGGTGMYFLLAVSVLSLGIIIDLGIFHLKTFRKINTSPLSFPYAPNEWEKIIFFRESETQWLGNLAAISTLLGLLGTVMGIHSAFESMKLYKQASPEIFASGISQALLTTIYGLSIAIPSTIAMHIYRNLLDTLDRKFQGSNQSI